MVAEICRRRENSVHQENNFDRECQEEKENEKQTLLFAQ
jgi:hypothetical protein